MTARQQRILGRLDELARWAEQEDEEQRLLRRQQKSEMDKLRRRCKQQERELLKLRQRCEQQVHMIRPLLDSIEKISRSPGLKEQAQKVRHSLDA